jgi:serine/threonine protein kinase
MADHAVGEDVLVGQTLGHYRIAEKIGAGGMGVVYRAHDEQLERDVALKVLPAGTLVDKASRKRFRKEAVSLARLNHPNIATIHEFGTKDGTDFLVTEYIGGQTLSDRSAPARDRPPRPETGQPAHHNRQPAKDS